MSAIEARPVARPVRRARLTAVVVLAVVAALAPAPASAASTVSFGPVSVGATKSLSATVPLLARLSDLPPSTVVYSGGGGSSLDFLLSAAGLSAPLTAGELLATVGDLTATYHLVGGLGSSLNFQLSAPACLTATISCEASVTFAPTEAGPLTTNLNWTITDLQVTGGGSFGSIVQLIAPFMAPSFASQLAIALDGIGVPSSDSVNAQVDIAASAACIELNTSSIDFGSTTLGAGDIAAQPTITVTNCSGVGETLYARGSDASGPSSAWSLVDSAATCASDLGLNNYRMSLALENLSVVGLSTLNKSLQPLAAGDDADQVAKIWTACPGSTGAGVVMTMQIHYLVVGD